jgi:hypothetical protein
LPLVDIVAFRYATLGAALATLVLAGWLLYLHPGNRLHRAFALFLLLKGLAYLLAALGASVDHWRGAFQAYILLALPFAGVYLMLRLRECFLLGQPRRRRNRTLAWSLLAGVVLVEGLYLWDHGLYAGRVDGEVVQGPLMLSLPLLWTTFAGVALSMAWQSRHAPDLRARQALSLGSLAFLLEPLYWASSFWTDAAATNALPAPVAESVIVAATFSLAILAAGLLTGRGGAYHGAAGRRQQALVLVAGGSGALASWATLQDPTMADRILFFGLDAFWHLALVVLTTVAVLRHRFLAMETQIRFSLQQGTVAAILVAAFFVVSESAQYKFGESLRNQYLGIIAAGLLVFAIAPLQRVAERLVRVAVPASRTGRLDGPSKSALYREQATFAWTDGSLTRKERQRLDHLRERLGIPVDEAAAIESEAVSGGPARGSGSPVKRARKATA